MSGVPKSIWKVKDELKGRDKETKRKKDIHVNHWSRISNPLR